MKKYIFFILAVMSCELWAKAELYPYVGEHHELLYFGTSFPENDFNWGLASSINGEEKYYRETIDQALSPALLGLVEDYNQELYQSALCSTGELKDHLEEIHFYFRALMISRKLEVWHFLNHFSESYYEKSCSEKPLNQLSLKKKSSKRMKQFLSLYKANAKITYDRFAKKTKKQLRAEVLSQEGLVRKFVTQNDSREKEYESLKYYCSMIKNQINDLALEKDYYFGQYHQEANVYLLMKANHLLSDVENQNTCFQRYAYLFRSREVKDPLAKFDDELTQTLQRENIPEQGRAFVYVELASFSNDKKISVLPEKKNPVAVGTKLNKKKTKSRVQTKKAGDQPKRLEKKLVGQSEEKPVTKEISTKVKSAFYQASELRRIEGMAKAKVDMLKFKYDYVFPLAVKENLRVVLKDYSSLRAIEEMHSFDKLGEKQRPVPLLFIKFLIDTNNHQGLFNLKRGLGDAFYVQSNLDGKKYEHIERVALELSYKTNQWEIFILTP